MKLKAFAKWLVSIGFKIDSENTGLVLAHFIHSKYNPPTTVGLEMILSLDNDGHFRRIYDKIKNPKLVGDELKKFKRAQKEILSGPLGVFLIEKITNTIRKSS